MPHADTPPATPTPEGLAAALAMIDRPRWRDVLEAETRPAVDAVYAVARAAVVRGIASGSDVYAYNDACNAEYVAMMGLCALATGAQAQGGEGAGGS